LKIESKISRKRMKLFQDTRETSPSPPSLPPSPLVGILGVGMHVVTWAGIQGQDREVGPMPGLIRAVNVKVAHIQLAAAGFSLLEERNITCPNDMKKRGLGWRGDCLCFHYSLLLPAWPAWLFIFYVYFHI
jgi:hypothetical protein